MSGEDLAAGRTAREGGSVDDLVTGYRPWLDGLRGVAVLMVVVQHTLGEIPVDLGFWGVLLFFALSGYLITSLLLDERAATGTLSLRAFYLRRAGRMVPALVLVVVVLDALFVIAGDYKPLIGSLTALTYTSNYAQIIDPGLVAVLGAPLDILAIGSLERADAMLYGCAAAIALRLGWRPRAWMLWVGVAAVGLIPHAFDGHPFVGSISNNALTAVAGAAIVVCLDYAPTRWLRRVLSLRPVVVVGVVSYGLYLWHGPAMRLAGDLGGSGPAWRAVAATAALGAAVLSYRLVELPMRAWARRRAAELRATIGGAGPPVELIQERFVLDPATARRG